jgi:hypothetical protein
MVFTGQIREGARSPGGNELVKRVDEEREVTQLDHRLRPRLLPGYSRSSIWGSNCW